MAQFEPMKDQIKRAGASLVYIAAQKSGGLMFNPEQFLQQHPLSFPFLLDQDRCVTKAYGVYHRIGLDAYDIARPASFVLGRDGVVRFAYVGSNQTDRAPLPALLRSLKKDGIGPSSKLRA